MVCIKNQENSIPAIAIGNFQAAPSLPSFCVTSNSTTARKLASVLIRTIIKTRERLESCTLACARMCLDVVTKNVIQLITIIHKLNVSQPIIIWVITSMSFISTIK